MHNNEDFVDDIVRDKMLNCNDVVKWFLYTFRKELWFYPLSAWITLNLKTNARHAVVLVYDGKSDSV